MPEMDGLAASREIRRIPSLEALPIVAMTAHAMMGDKEKSLDAGMNDHVTKPIDVNDVYARIIRWIPADDPGGSKEDAPSPPASPAPKDGADAPAARAPVVRLSSAMEDSPQPPLPEPDAAVRDAVARPAFLAPRVIPADMPGMAFSEGLKLLHNNRQMYLKLLVRMSASLPELRGQINEALMLGDLDSIRDITQAIASSARNLGLTEMGDAAERFALAANPKTSFSILFLCSDALERSVDRFLAVTASLRE
jgi:two-component system sensor histidine kinase/response regulator